MSDEKLKNENDNVVLAFFADRAAAEDAIEGIKIWDRSTISSSWAPSAPSTRTATRSRPR